MGEKIESEITSTDEQENNSGLWQYPQVAHVNRLYRLANEIEINGDPESYMHFAEMVLEELQQGAEGRRAQVGRVELDSKRVSATTQHRIADALERIADALEKLAEGGHE